MRYIYTICYWLLLPFILLRLLWRSRKAPTYRRRLLERFAIFAAPEKTGSLWVHAVSLGEVIAAIPLIQEFQKQYPREPITITTMTPTGSQKVRAVFGHNVFHVYFPYDIPSLIQRFINKVKPRELVIIETELWPNLLAVARKNQVPVLLANARLSERSARNYGRVKSLSHEMMQNISHIAVQTKAEALRYIALGLPTDRITITGSIKFDIKIPPDLEDKAAGLRRLLGSDRPIWIAASTHEGEEEKVLAAHAKIRAQVPNVLLILVPRHPERFNDVINLCKKQGYRVVLRSDDKPCSADTDIFVGNTMGELLLFYAVSDVAFVGGSLAPIGGHNLLEPAALAKPTITGFHMENFIEITRLLLEANGLRQIHDSNQLAEALLQLFQDRSLLVQIGQNAQEVVANNRGALARQLELVARLYRGNENGQASLSYLPPL